MQLGIATEKIPLLKAAHRVVSDHGLASLPGQRVILLDYHHSLAALVHSVDIDDLWLVVHGTRLTNTHQSGIRERQRPPGVAVVVLRAYGYSSLVLHETETVAFAGNQVLGLGLLIVVY